MSTPPCSSSGITGAEHTSPQKAGFVMCLFEARTRKMSRTSKKLETSFHGRISAEVMFSSSSFITLRYLSIGTKKQTNSDTLPIWKIASRAAAACKIFLQKSPVRQSQTQRKEVPEQHPRPQFLPHPCRQSRTRSSTPVENRTTRGPKWRVPHHLLHLGYLTLRFKHPSSQPGTSCTSARRRG